MTDWQHGYVTDMPYTFGFYKESAPNWLDWVALLRGSEPSPTVKNVLELGCGQGYGLCVMAAANPDLNFIGVDFNPEHIAHARSLVRRTGLKNAVFHEGDFVSMAETDLLWSECDYVVAHGILSWVNFEVRHAIFKIIDKCLSPGGLGYFSYNALPGWLATHPVQHIMRQYADRTGINSISFESALNILNSLKDANAAVFRVQPGLVSRLEQLQKHPKDQSNYLYHEYFNGAWSLFYSTQVAEEASVGKLRFLGSATLPDNYDGMLPENMRKVLDSAPDPAMRELFKDLLINQSFRRDVLVRGQAPVWAGEQLNLLNQRMVTLLQNPENVSLKFKTSFGEVNGNESVYKPLLHELTKGPRNIAELTRVLPDMNVSSLLQAISMLAHEGAIGFYIHNAKKRPAQQFNQILAASVSRGAPYRFAALPGIGSGIVLDELQWMALDTYHQGANNLEGYAAGVDIRLRNLNKSLVRDGKPIAHGDEMINELRARLEPFVSTTLPMLKRLGGVK
jgi:SAM-dependent methyltransferase